MFRLQCQVTDGTPSYEELLTPAAPEVSQAAARRVVEALAAAGVDAVLAYDTIGKANETELYEVEVADDRTYLAATFLQHQVLVDADTYFQYDMSPDEAFGLLRTFLRTIEQVTGWRCLDWDNIEEQYRIALSG